MERFESDIGVSNSIKNLTPEVRLRSDSNPASIDF